MEEQEKHQVSEDNNNPGHPEWTRSDADRSGQKPNGFYLRDLEFGSKDSNSTPALEKLGLEPLIGANAFESADIKANHVEPGVLTGMLSETISKLEEKYHSGVYDAAAMPLVKQYLDEMKKMADVQLERQELIARRVTDIKQANEAAYKAVNEVREKREEDIRHRASYIQDELRLKQYKDEERKKARKEAREYRRTLKELDKLDKAILERSKNQTNFEVDSIDEEFKVKEATMFNAQKESQINTQLVKDELERAEALRDARLADLSGAEAAVSAAEKNIAATRAEITEKELREKHLSVSKQTNRAVAEAKALYDEQMNTVKKEVDKLSEQLKSSEDGKDKDNDMIKKGIKNISNLVGKFKSDNGKKQKEDTKAKVTKKEKNSDKDSNVAMNNDKTSAKANVNKNKDNHSTVNFNKKAEVSNKDNAKTNQNISRNDTKKDSNNTNKNNMKADNNNAKKIETNNKDSNKDKNLTDKKTNKPSNT